MECMILFFLGPNYLNLHKKEQEREKIQDNSADKKHKLQQKQGSRIKI